MHPHLSRALEGLEVRDQTLSVFVRDDDAGWGHDALLALLDVTLEADVPIDLAAIPGALEDRVVADLRQRVDAAPQLVGVHQHGYTHANHELEGRRCEFGRTRGLEQQHRDIAAGRAVLHAAFGERVDAIFTPPWNRCTAETGAALARLGFVALSRDRRATPPTVMPELAVDVDWSRAWREGGKDATALALAQSIESRSQAATPLGLMLHHAAMDGAELACLALWLAELRRHPRLTWKPMRACLRAGVTPESTDVLRSGCPALS